MNDARTLTDHFFFGSDSTSTPDQTAAFVAKALVRADGGELFLQRSVSHVLVFSDGKLETNKKSMSQGFGFRRIVGDSAAYAFSNELSAGAFNRAAKATTEILRHRNLTTKIELPSTAVLPLLYTNENPLEEMPEQERVKLLSDIDQYARSRDSRIKQVNVAIGTSWSPISIIRRDGTRLDDLRPMAQLSVSIMMEENGHREDGQTQLSGRVLLSDLLLQTDWRELVDHAVAQANTSLRAIDAPAGEMPVVIGNGWGAVLLHEAVGHGLEGDAARKGSTAFKMELLGQKVASDNVTVFDQGNIPGARGSLNFDDEGTPTQMTTLIEKGFLVGYMHDSLSARALGVAPTGNARRESFKNMPIPRMTTTFMAAGQHDPEEIIASVDRGVYVVDFRGGQVDTASGNFVFAATESYMIENGKVGSPVKGVTLIGNGPEAMTKVDMVGNDLAIGRGGSCGKDRQTVPVGLGQPTVKIGRSIKVGGTGLG